MNFVSAFPARLCPVEPDQTVHMSLHTKLNTRVPGRTNTAIHASRRPTLLQLGGAAATLAVLPSFAAPKPSFAEEIAPKPGAQASLIPVVELGPGLNVSRVGRLVL